MGLLPLQERSKEAHEPNLDTEPGALGAAVFSTMLACFVARQSRQNRTVFGMLLRNNGITNTSRLLPRFWNQIV